MKRAQLIAGLVSIIALGFAVPAASADILPVATWPFNEGVGTVAHDVSGWGHNGTLQGGVSWTKGRFDGALSFDGNSGAVDVPDSSAFEPAKTLSISAWVNASQSPGDYRYIVSKGANGCLTASYGLYTGPNGGLIFYVSQDGLTGTWSPDAGTGVWNGQWHNVVGTYDGTTVRLYVDGVQVGSGTPATSSIVYGLPTSNDLEIGDYAGCSLDFQGSIDNVRIFNRALGSQEINLAYRVSNVLPPFSPFDLML